MNKQIFMITIISIFLLLNKTLMALTLERDTVNCLDSNNFFYIKNFSKSPISIDSIGLKNLSSQWVGNIFTMDTGKIHYHSVNCTLDVHNNKLAIIKNCHLSIGAQDSLKCRNLTITALATHGGNLYELFFFSANNVKDSMYAIVKYRIFGNVIFQPAQQLKMAKQKIGAVCSLNGREIRTTTDNIQIGNARKRLALQKNK